jgi:hypothetical protein
MALDYTCDFCPDGKLNIIEGTGKQVLVRPSSFVNKPEAKYTPRMKFQCKRCLKLGVTTTEDNLTVCSSMSIVKYSDVKHLEVKNGTVGSQAKEADLPSGTN